jgi:hypothetical protein
MDPANSEKIMTFAMFRGLIAAKYSINENEIVHKTILDQLYSFCKEVIAEAVEDTSYPKVDGVKFKVAINNDQPSDLRFTIGKRLPQVLGHLQGLVSREGWMLSWNEFEVGRSLLEVVLYGDEWHELRKLPVCPEPVFYWARGIKLLSLNVQENEKKE